MTNWQVLATDSSASGKNSTTDTASWDSLSKCFRESFDSFSFQSSAPANFDAEMLLEAK